MQTFSEPFILTKGGPAGSSTTPVLFLYQEGFIYSRMGTAYAAGVVIALIIFVLSLLEQKLLTKDTD
jgi:multiple sugar transport system permease protein